MLTTHQNNSILACFLPHVSNLHEGYATMNIPIGKLHKRKTELTVTIMIVTDEKLESRCFCFCFLLCFVLWLLTILLESNTFTNIKKLPTSNTLNGMILSSTKL